LNTLKRDFPLFAGKHKENKERRERNPNGFRWKELNSIKSKHRTAEDSATRVIIA
jgi:hypothetical protein